jgi:hypothetical protein
MREKKNITREREREREKKEQQNVFRSDDESAEEAKNGSERLVGCYRE